jgi:threonine/homoserine/homoserine lactone efflux protein
MAGLLIFIEIALAGCAFLLYFLFMLWRDSRKARPGQRVEIRKLASRSAQRGKVLHLYNIDELAKANTSRRKARL